MNHWKVILATMAIFAAGVITGGLLVRQAAPPAPVPAAPVAVRTNPPPVFNPPQLQRLELLHRVRRELDLTPEQHARLEQIIREGQERSRKIWERVAPEMRQELQAVHEQIRAELNPAQRRQFEQLLRQPGRPGPDGAPPVGERLRERFRSGERATNAPVRPPRREPPPPGTGPAAP